jgi:hypothetical protein
MVSVMVDKNNEWERVWKEAVIPIPAFAWWKGGRVQQISG